MRIKEIRTRVMRWRGKTVPLPPHFCTNPMDLLNLPEASMQAFAFHGWLVVEIFTDDGLAGIGNAALAPQVTKQVIATPQKMNARGAAAPRDCAISAGKAKMLAPIVVLMMFAASPGTPIARSSWASAF